MNLRTRLLLGFGYLILLLLLTAGSAAVGFFHISEAIDQILEENFRSVSAAVGMLDSLETQTTMSIDLMLTGEYEVDTFDNEDESFEQHLSLALGNITVEGEAEVLEELVRDYATYKAVRDRILLEERQRPLIIYQRELFPRYSEVQRGVFALLNINHQAIIRADQNARSTALQTAGWLGLLVTISLVSMAVLARMLQQAVLSRFDELTDAAEAIILGEKSRRFEVSGQDELSVVAGQLNSALDARDELETEMRGRLNHQKQLVLAMLEEIDGPQWLMGLNGHVIAATGDALPTPMMNEIHALIQRERRAFIDAFQDDYTLTERTYTLHGIQIRLKLVVAPGHRPVGWLLKPLGPEPADRTKTAEPDSQQS